MTNIFDLEIFHEDINSIISMKEYKLFDEALGEIDDLFPEELILTEEVIDNNGSLRKRVKKSFNTTQKVTHSTVKIGTSAAKLSGAVIKTEWTIFARCCRLCANVVNFISKGFEKLPKAINFAMDKLEAMPQAAVGKIRGDITLCIQAHDFQNLYASGLIGKLKQYVTILSTVSEGEAWNNIFHFFQISSRKTSDENSGGKNLMNIIFGQNDMKLIKKLSDVADKIDTIELKPVVINVHDKNNIEIYFSKNKNVKFVDDHGKQHEFTYLEAMGFLLKDLENSSEEIKKMQGKFGNKLDATTTNSSFARLNRHDQQAIEGVLKESAEVLGKLGRIMNAIVKDIKSINEGYIKVLEYARFKGLAS